MPEDRSWLYGPGVWQNFDPTRASWHRVVTLACLTSHTYGDRKLPVFESLAKKSLSHIISAIASGTLHIDAEANIDKLGLVSEINDAANMPFQKWAVTDATFTTGGGRYIAPMALRLLSTLLIEDVDHYAPLFVGHTHDSGPSACCLQGFCGKWYRGQYFVGDRYLIEGSANIKGSLTHFGKKFPIEADPELARIRDRFNALDKTYRSLREGGEVTVCRGPHEDKTVTVRGIEMKRWGGQVLCAVPGVEEPEWLTLAALTAVLPSGLATPGANAPAAPVSARTQAGAAAASSSAADAAMPSPHPLPPRRLI